MSISFIAFDCLEFDFNCFSGSGCYIISEVFLSKINCLKHFDKDCYTLS